MSKVDALYKENFIFKSQHYSKHNEFDVSNKVYQALLKGEDIFAQ
jgi:hypothetical protein